MHNWIARVPITEYNAIEAEHYSQLKYAHTSPLHYHHAGASSKHSTFLALGDATHAAILEPERFASEYHTYPGAVRRGAAWEDWKRQHPGSTSITADERQAAEAMADSVRSNPAAASYLARGEAEVAMVWTDPQTGLRCKGRADWLTLLNSDPCLVGVKTARSVTPRQFGAQAASLAYHLQWAMYAEGYHEITGLWPHMVEIAVESSPPHDVAVYVIDEDVLDAGRIVFRECLNKVVACKRTCVFPGQAPEPLNLVLPPWAPGIEVANAPAIELDGESLVA